MSRVGHQNFDYFFFIKDEEAVDPAVVPDSQSRDTEPPLIPPLLSEWHDFLHCHTEISYYIWLKQSLLLPVYFFRQPHA